MTWACPCFPALFSLTVHSSSVKPKEVCAPECAPRRPADSQRSPPTRRTLHSQRVRAAGTASAWPAMQPRDLALRRAGLKRADNSKWIALAAGALVLFIGFNFRNAAESDHSSRQVATDLGKLKADLARTESLSRAVETAATPVPGPVPAPAAASAAVPANVRQPPASNSIEQQQPLPECSVVFFHHLEKTAGTTLRSILQRNAQLGHFDFISFINRYNKLHFQMVTHRLDISTLLDCAEWSGCACAIVPITSMVAGDEKLQGHLRWWREWRRRWSRRRRRRLATA